MRTRNLIAVLFLSVILWAILTAAHPCEAASAEASDGIVWRNIETGHAIIRYRAPEDLERFDKSIDYSPGVWGITRLFSSQESDALPDRLKKKVDALYERVMEILDMRKKLKKVTINIYHDKKQLHAAYGRLYKTESPYRSRYTYENNTIYVNVDDLTEGILAYEMAHAIIDHFLVIRPPEATA
ncbi:MAG: hypothetical protein JRD89_09190, partial [Deltaproteobacteria bacterium]|nr:hypothetical protein [Deltaproteobacteria bacterium]